MNELVVIDALPVSAKDLQRQVNAIQEAMEQVMKRDTHFGVIPGCGDKPTLLKPGAEKLGLMFRLIPCFEIQRQDLTGGHREYSIVCTLNDPNGRVMGQGVGSASTMESKHRYRGSGERTCPQCGKAAIIKGKEQFGGGWICFKKKDGCGYKFEDKDPAITSQSVEKKENPDIADVYNTVLKMAKKRAHVDAILTTTAASDIFTQDIEDMGPVEVSVVPALSPPQKTESPKKALKSLYPVEHWYRILNITESQEQFMATVGEWREDVQAWLLPGNLSPNIYEKLKPNEVSPELFESEQRQAEAAAMAGSGEPDATEVEPVIVPETKETPLQKAQKRAAAMEQPQHVSGALAKLEALKQAQGGK